MFFKDTCVLFKLKQSLLNRVPFFYFLLKPIGIFLGLKISRQNWRVIYFSQEYIVKPRSPAAQGSRLSLPTRTWLPLFHRLCRCEKKLANWIVLLKTVVFSLDSWIKEFTPKLEGDLFHQKKLARRVYLFMIFFKMKISLNK